MLDLYCFDIGTLQAQECSVNKEGINEKDKIVHDKHKKQKCVLLLKIHDALPDVTKNEY